jgi:hypothetical protein
MNLRTHGHRTVGIVFATIAGAMVVGGAAAHSSHTAAPAPAQRFVASNGSDSNPCTRTAPCQSLDRAYRAARPGDVVEIAGGTYTGSPDIHHDQSKTSSDDVVFRPAAGANAVFTQQLHVYASHVTIDGSTGHITINSFEILSESMSRITTDVTLEHIDAAHGQSQIETSNGVTISDLDIGGSCTGEDALRIISNFDLVGADPRNVVVEDSRIGNICLPADSGAHPDCLAISGGQHITIRRNKIWYCGTQGLYTAIDFGTASIDNVLIENNWFGSCDTPGDGADGCYYSLHIRAGTNIVIRYNSIAVNEWGGFGSQDSSVLLYGNAGEGPECGGPGVTYAYNVWDDAKCSATDIKADPMFVKSSGSDFDLHLQPTSPAIGRGDPTRLPSSDFDSQRRISPPDAGADERPWLAATVGRKAVTLRKGAAKAKRLATGVYKLTVLDQSATGNLHVRGPGVNRRTSVKGTGPATWRLSLKAGTYNFWSDADPKRKTELTVSRT